MGDRKTGTLCLQEGPKGGAGFSVLREIARHCVYKRKRVEIESRQMDV